MAVTTDDVKKIYPTTADLSGQLTIAQLIVSEQLQSKGLSSAMLDQITIYLAAHFAVITYEKGGLDRKKMGEADENYRTPDPNAVGFATTRFGQQAMMLDTSGTLASIGATGGRLPATFDVVSPSCDPYSYGYYFGMIP